MLLFPFTVNHVLHDNTFNTFIGSSVEFRLSSSHWWLNHLVFISHHHLSFYLQLFFLIPFLVEVNAISGAQLCGALASSLLNELRSAWRLDDREICNTVGRCSEVWLMMIGVNTVARQSAHLLASLRCRPLGKETGLSSISSGHASRCTWRIPHCPLMST